MKLKQIFLLLSIAAPILLNAQTSPQLSASEIKLGIKKLQVIGSVLYIAAHPDDENTRLLAYLAQDRKVRTGYLSLTRGDGGQNLIGNEQAERLGLIRTQELLAARKIDGAEQFFSRAIDFGFSKNSEEALKIWGEEQILSDAVWVIRKFQPDVIVTRFPEDSRAGHGQHAASAIIAREAFFAAADPKRFPEQLKYVKPWQAKRIFWNTYNFGSINTTSSNQLQLNIGIYNPLLGKGYGEIAAESRSKHKSQGFGAAKNRGKQLEFFAFTAGDSAKTDILDGVDLSWNRIKNGAKIERLLLEADRNFNIENPSQSVNKLIDILSEIEKIDDSYWKVQKSKEIKQLIAACAGLWFESYSTEATYAVADSIRLKHQVIVHSDVPVTLKQVVDGQALPLNKNLTANVLETFETLTVANKISQPYWLEEKPVSGAFTIKEQQLIGQPENTDRLSAVFTFKINGKDISYTNPVVYKFTDPVRGEVYRYPAVTPPVTISPEQNIFFFRDKNSQMLRVKLTAQKDNIRGIIGATTSVPLSPIPFTLNKKGDVTYADIIIRQNKMSELNRIDEGYVFAEIEGKRFPFDDKTISYEHIPVISYFPTASFKFMDIDLKTNGKRIGYLPGAGDRIPEALRLVGYKVDVLTEEQVVRNDLSGYDAVITGVRLYNISTQIKNIQSKLVEYVKNGGTFLVQYNVSNGLKTTQIGPYPFKLSNSRVTAEDSKVTFTNPTHPVLNYPNKITEKDFEGWVQERGLYFASDIDPNYNTPLKMNDADEPENNGALLIGNYGKGKFVYTSLSFFRQLPAGVPGAYRLFVNLIAKNSSNEK